MHYSCWFCSLKLSWLPASPRSLMQCAVVHLLEWQADDRASNALRNSHVIFIQKRTEVFMSNLICPSFIWKWVLLPLYKNDELLSVFEPLCFVLWRLLSILGSYGNFRLRYSSPLNNLSVFLLKIDLIKSINLQVMQHWQMLESCLVFGQ